MAQRVLDAILPAGGRLDAATAAKAGVAAKALIPFNGIPLVQTAIDAVLGETRIRRTTVIGNQQVRDLAQSKGLMALEEGASGPENMFNGLEALCAQPDPPTHVLLATCDLPFLKAEHLAWIIDRAPESAGISLGAVRKSDFAKAYPGCPSTFVNLKDESLTLGSAFVLDVEAMRKARPHIETVFQRRKDKIGMAKMLGFGFVLRFLSKSLTVADIEKKAKQLLGIEAVALVGAPAELACDVDDIEDYDYVKTLLPN